MRKAKKAVRANTSGGSLLLLLVWSDLLEPWWAWWRRFLEDEDRETHRQSTSLLLVFWDRCDSELFCWPGLGRCDRRPPWASQGSLGRHQRALVLVGSGSQWRGSRCRVGGGFVVTSEERFCRAVEMVLRHEGGYVYDPADPGGETKYGISKRSYPQLDIRNLIREQAIEIYRRDWWDRYGYDRIKSLDVATKVLDLAVNMGPAAAHRLLQEALVFLGHQLAVDGILGPKTLAAVNAEAPPRLLQ